MAGERKPIAALANGGNVSRSDVECSLSAKRLTFVMRGTGCLADDITLTGNVFAVDVSQKPEAILDILKTKL